jgi:hypothetical protein
MKSVQILIEQCVTLHVMIILTKYVVSWRQICEAYKKEYESVIF